MAKYAYLQYESLEEKLMCQGHTDRPVISIGSTKLGKTDQQRNKIMLAWMCANGCAGEYAQENGRNT